MNLTNLGLILLFIAIILIFIGSFQSKNVKGAGGIFIGPFPLFGFGDKKMFYILWILAIVLFILFLIFRKVL